MKTRSLTLAGVALSVFCAAGLAYIHPNAPSTAQSLANNAAATHSYMHGVFPSSYGSHGMEVTADDLNVGLFEWEFGLATECDVEPQLTAVTDAFIDMTTQFLTNGIFMDPQAVTHYYDVYFDVGVVKFYLSQLVCNTPHPGTVSGAKRVKPQGKANGASFKP